MERSINNQKEELDNLELAGPELSDTLEGLAKINKWLGNRRALLKALRKVIRAQQNNVCTIVDLGCGGGDNLLALGKWLETKKIKAKLIGIDGNKNSIEFATKSIPPQNGFVEYIFSAQDILTTDFELPTCEVCISSHFMYHYDLNHLSQFINKYGNKGVSFLFSELRPSAMAIALFRVFGGFFAKNEMTKSDGQIALRRSITYKQWQQIEQGLSGLDFTLKRKPIFRYLVKIQKK